MVTEKSIKQEYDRPQADFYNNHNGHNDKNLYTFGDYHPMIQFNNQQINTSDQSMYYNQQFPAFVPTYIKQEPNTETTPSPVNYMSPMFSEDEARTNFLIDTTRQAYSSSGLPHNYPTPSPSPTSENEDRIKEERKLSDVALKGLIQLKTQVASNNYGVMRPKVDFQPLFQQWVGCGIYHQMPKCVLKIFDTMMREGYKIKNELLDLMNRICPDKYEYNPNKSHIILDYDKITIMVIRTLNNVASRRSRHRKKFVNQIKKNCLKIDINESVLLRKQEDHLQELVQKLEGKVLDSNIDHFTLLAMRESCGLI